MSSTKQEKQIINSEIDYKGEKWVVEDLCRELKITQNILVFFALYRDKTVQEAFKICRNLKEVKKIPLIIRYKGKNTNARALADSVGLSYTSIVRVLKKGLNAEDAVEYLQKYGRKTTKNKSNAENPKEDKEISKAEKTKKPEEAAVREKKDIQKPDGVETDIKGRKLYSMEKIREEIKIGDEFILPIQLEDKVYKKMSFKVVKKYEYHAILKTISGRETSRTYGELLCVRVATENN